MHRCGNVKNRSRYVTIHPEWATIKPMLPNKPRGRVNDRRRHFWVLRSGAPRRDLPDSSFPHRAGGYRSCSHIFLSIEIEVLEPTPIVLSPESRFLTALGFLARESNDTGIMY